LGGGGGGGGREEVNNRCWSEMEIKIYITFKSH
jgi:hypothetical protein